MREDKKQVLEEIVKEAAEIFSLCDDISLLRIYNSDFHPLLKEDVEFLLGRLHFYLAKKGVDKKFDHELVTSGVSDRKYGRCEYVFVNNPLNVGSYKIDLSYFFNTSGQGA